MPKHPPAFIPAPSLRILPPHPPLATPPFSRPLPTAVPPSARRARVALSAVAETPPASLPVPFAPRAAAHGDSDLGASAEGEEGKQLFRVGMPHTPATRAKISAGNKGKVPWNKGRKHSAETKRKIAEGTKRAMNSPETRARMRAVALGRRHSHETRERIAAACGRVKAVRESRRRTGVKRIIVGNQRERRRVEFEWARQREALLERIGRRAVGVDFKAVTRNAAAGQKLRRPMTVETKEKLSRRIKEMWADPEYRDRVKSGVQNSARMKGSVRSPLTDEHRERIRQSLLRRNAKRRGNDSGKADGSRSGSGSGSGGSVRSFNRKMDPREGTRLAGQIVHETRSDEEIEMDVAEEKRLRLERKRVEGIQWREDFAAQTLAADRKAARQKKFAEGAEKRAAQQRVQDTLLLEVLASAGQLPDGESLVSGSLPTSSPVIFDGKGLRTAGDGGFFESAIDSSSLNGESSDATRLVFSSGGGRSSETAVAAPSSSLFMSESLLDFDIYAPPQIVVDDDDDSSDEVPVRRASQKSRRRRSHRTAPREASSSALLIPGGDGGAVDSGRIIFRGDEDVDSVLAEVAQAAAPAESSELNGTGFLDQASAESGQESEQHVVGEEEDESVSFLSEDGSGCAFRSDSGVDESRGDGHRHGAFDEVTKNKKIDKRKRVVTYVDGAAHYVYVN